MSWVVLVPLKAAGDRKTRLAGALSPDQRHGLSERMADHVIGVLRRCEEVASVQVVSPDAVRGAGWITDEGRGLNVELTQAMARFGDSGVAIVHADLPLLAEEDVLALLAAATASGCALAPDGHGAGTNALALRQGAVIGLSFGTGSLARHRAGAEQAGLGPAIVRRAGLALDIDVADDLIEAEKSRSLPWTRWG